MCTREPELLRVFPGRGRPEVLSKLAPPLVNRNGVTANHDASMAGTRNFHPVESISGGEPGYLRFACIDNVGDAAPRPALGAVRGYPLTLDQHSPLHLHLLPGEKAESGAIFLRDRLFTLPTHSRVSRADLARLASWIAMPTPISPRPNSAH